jgi:LacI family transcriptional regulator
MAITIKDIAKLAGVSRGTVDRVLNNRGKVAEKVRLKVLNIAQEYGYTKNILASRLSINEVINIAIILPDYKVDKFWKLPFDGIQNQEAKMKPFGIVITYYLFDLLDVHDYEKMLEKATRSKPNAVLLAPVFKQESLKFLAMMNQNNIPVVCINSELDVDTTTSYIGQNSLMSGRLAGKLFNLTDVKKNKIFVITFGHNSNNATHIQKKITGLKEYNFENNAGFIIEDIQIENFLDISNLQALASQIETEKDNVRGLFFTNSRSYHFLNNKDIVHSISKVATIVGFDLLEENIDLLEKDKIDFILNQNPKNQGKYGLMSLFDHFIYSKPIQKIHYLQTDIVVKENYKNYINQHVYQAE